MDGIVFWRLLGTGRAASTSQRADLRRTAMFAVWEDEDALDAFLAQHPIAARWSGRTEAWHVRLRSLGGHGRWRGFDVLDGMEPGEAAGPVAVMTRADVRPGAWREFSRSAREVSTELRDATGLLAVVGVGEAPMGRMATFSLWRSAADVRQFAYGLPRHRRVIGQARQGEWYSEEMFARFEPYGSTGSWDGGDPLRQSPSPSVGRPDDAP